MINYELAKQLKDAGFPQYGRSHEWFDSKGEFYIKPISVTVCPVNKMKGKIKTINNIPPDFSGGRDTDNIAKS